jgi:hypothetical protein
MYRIIAQVNGVPYAAARYRITSTALLRVSVTPGQIGEQVQVRGLRFLPHLTLVLVAYSVDTRARPILLGVVRTGRHGTFRFVASSQRLVPGQYLLRAWSVSQVSAQMAEGFFEVVV